MLDSNIPLLARVSTYGQRVALYSNEQQYTYATLYTEALQIAYQLCAQGLKPGGCVLHWALADATYVSTQWGIWLAGGIAVPVSTSYPLPEITYLATDSQAHHFILPDALLAQFEALKDANPDIQLLSFESLLGNPMLHPPSLPEVSAQAPALMIYTSGTTGKPKGVVSTHQIIAKQIQTLVTAWAWQADDCILLPLPLHHIHGLINVLCSALWVGAQVVMMPKFEAQSVYRALSSGRYTLFMAVPTIYHRLLATHAEADIAAQTAFAQACRQMRLMVSGSAALPVQVLEAWEKLSGHTLLERYGMTEIGMALSNPLQGVRKAGTVGLPLPEVRVRLVDEQGTPIEAWGEPGEIQVQSPCLFVAYWQKPEATAASFTPDGWFQTGDIAERDAEGYYRILGRKSTDIIKSGGYKISALEIEEVLRQHPLIADCAVVGLPDVAMGERIAVAYVPRSVADTLSLEALRDWAKTKLAPYKIPVLLSCCEELPRNAMGKVLKKAVKELF
ncbi:acyl-CoA synthetase [Eisenibacter elegans]|jgi:malonyl-CoA/methylmalonyl-CoA synthetase|uniref:acyl-CoA synthetase n=1 Tax=Eisenibacter elegans TaxID=997 RepID=UPI00055707E9|nr:acyl-CoA synthetase [Eisenibacter elegans]